MSQVTFFQNFSNRDEVPKKLQHYAISVDNILNFTVKDDCSFENPRFIFGSQRLNLNNVNYLYFREFGRYYYIDDIIQLQNGCVELVCSEDCLQTWWSDIKDIQTVIERQEDVNNCNPFIPDDMVIGRIDKQITKLQLANPVGGAATGAHIALTVTGG